MQEETSLSTQHIRQRAVAEDPDVIGSHDADRCRGLLLQLLSLARGHDDGDVLEEHQFGRSIVRTGRVSCQVIGGELACGSRGRRRFGGGRRRLGVRRDQQALSADGRCGCRPEPGASKPTGVSDACLTSRLAAVRLQRLSGLIALSLARHRPKRSQPVPKMVPPTCLSARRQGPLTRISRTGAQFRLNGQRPISDSVRPSLTARLSGPPGGTIKVRNELAIRSSRVVGWRNGGDAVRTGAGSRGDLCGAAARDVGEGCAGHHRAQWRCRSLRPGGGGR